MPTFALEERFRTGQDLYGDDFDAEAIAAWFRDEENAYAELWHESSGDYAYHALNRWHGFRHLPAGPLGSVLAFGSAHGHDIEPLLGRIQQVTLLDSSESMATAQLAGVSIQRKKAQPSGDVPCDSGSFELVTCFGVLHHIPNVSHVLAELHRTLRVGGWLLLREPSTSMGDWTIRRPGLTPRERGIPGPWMLERLRRTGFDIVRAAPCHFPPWTALSQRAGLARTRPELVVRVDAQLSRLFAWNWRYVSDHAWQKLRPGSIFYVARKRA